MYHLKPTTKFKKDLKKVKNSKKDFALAVALLRTLEKEGGLGVPKIMRPHKLTGNYKDNWECHIKPDLLIIWIQIESPNIIKLIRIGSHSDLFK